MNLKSVGGLLGMMKLEAVQLSSVSKRRKSGIIALEQGQTTGPHFRENFQMCKRRGCLWHC